MRRRKCVGCRRYSSTGKKEVLLDCGREEENLVPRNLFAAEGGGTDNVSSLQLIESVVEGK